MADHSPARGARWGTRGVRRGDGWRSSPRSSWPAAEPPVRPLRPTVAAPPALPPRAASSPASPLPGSTIRKRVTRRPACSVTPATCGPTEGISPDPGYQTAVETPEGVGRTISQSYVCLPDDGLASRGAMAMVTRNFGYTVTDKGSTCTEEPAEEPADHLHPGAPVPRRGARARWRGRRDAGAGSRRARGTWVRRALSSTPARASRRPDSTSTAPKADAGMVAYAETGDHERGPLLDWESVVVTQVKDRLDDHCRP